MHFPTDVNLLWHAQRQCLDWIGPYTQFIKKGQLFPPVELGHKLLLTTDQHELILDCRAMAPQSSDADESVGVADRLLGRYGAEAIHPEPEF